MKKIIAITSLALIVVMLAAALCACGSKVDNAIVGTWTYNGETFVFNSNGKGYISLGGDKEQFSYTANNGRVEMTYTFEGGSETEGGSYRIEGDRLYITWDWNRTDVYTKA